MAQELSGVTVVIFIACGILTLTLLFIFAKRQIMRFALRSRRGPHVPIGHGAKSSLKREIDHYIDVIPRIVYEPVCLEDGKLMHTTGMSRSYICRLKVVSEVKILEKEISKQDPNLKRHPNDNLRSFLLLALAAPLNGCGQKLVHQFCDIYEHARHDPSEFGDEEYQIFNKLLSKLVEVAKLIKSHPNSKRNSPNKTPVKKSLTSELQFCPGDRKYEDDILRLSDKDYRIQNLIGGYDDNETSV